MSFSANNRPVNGASERDIAEPWLHRPLAIVGMACRLPGADGLEEYWRLLSSGGSAIRRMPDHKLDRDLYFSDVKGQRGKTYSDMGGFVTERSIDFDLLGIPKSEASLWDACHLAMAEVAFRAFQHAGYDPASLPTKDVGVFVGHSGGTTLGSDIAYRELLDDYLAIWSDLPLWKREFGQKSSARFADERVAEVTKCLRERLQSGRRQREAGRPWVDAGQSAALIGRLLGVNGPHMAIDAACASSLVALALASNALHSGAAEIAVVGGASYNKADSLILFSHAQSCSATMSRPFDEQADGLIGSEGCVAVLVKTLARAERDGDTIHGVIRGIGMASDGRGRSLWAPRKEGQLAAIRRAYPRDVPPESVQLIEAHATSTRVGDATEMEALADFYSDYVPDGSKLPVGSVKSNIGHTLETAGLAGLVKSLLAMQHEIMPASVNVKDLSTAIPWQRIPLEVLRERRAWPTPQDGKPRRAAVNAFGIGGLNVHVVVEQYQAVSSSAEHATPASDVARRGQVLKNRACGVRARSVDPIAVVGRGVILPGALHLDALEKLLARPTEQLSCPPQERWPAGSWNEFRAGFVQRYQYDWKTHKIPPKQIQQANPLQFMLLDAAGQALKEAGWLQRSYDRAGMAVVVGSPFGGDFGNALYAGLRLPEFRQQAFSVLAESGFSPEFSEQLLSDYEAEFLRCFPALLDETGSFTSSTLASRLSKTFDLMGGAMAIDAGSTSGDAALSAACGLLRGRAVQSVMCAAAQRSLDRSAITISLQNGRLKVSSDGRLHGHSLGEGVALVILKRLEDAVRDSDPVFAVIGDVATGYSRDQSKQAIQHALDGITFGSQDSHDVSRESWQRRLVVGKTGNRAIDEAVTECAVSSHDVVVSTPLVDQVGHLQSAQGVLSLIIASTASGRELIEQEAAEARAKLAGSTGNVNDTPDRQSTSLLIMNESVTGQAYVTELEVETVSRSVGKKTKICTNELHVLRCSSPDRDGLHSQLKRIAEGRLYESGANISLAGGSAQDEGGGANPCSVRGYSFPKSEPWRACIVGFKDELPSKAAILLEQLGSSRAADGLVEQGMMFATPDELERRRANSKLAWVFPGQGAQYPQMLQKWVESNCDASGALEEANAALEALQQPSFESMAWGQAEGLGKDIWQTQATMLIADYILDQTLRGFGLRPDLVCGHSFGEFPAMRAAGCWDLHTALLATWHRCKAVQSNMTAGFGMLSVQAELPQVEELLAKVAVDIAVSHRNSPRQIVVGGPVCELQKLEAVFSGQRIAYRRLSVPTAFHTAALQPAQQPFADALQRVFIDVPKIALLSSVDNRLVVEPEQIREGLVRQLVQPLNYVGLVHRLEELGAGLAIEVGPQQILTRLSRQCEASFPVLACDHPSRSPSFQLATIAAQCELLDFSRQDIESRNVTKASSKRIVELPNPVHFDATVPRRKRNRVQAGSVTSENGQQEAFAVVPVAAHDATQKRRQANRQSGSLPPRMTESAAHASEERPGSNGRGESELVKELKSEVTVGSRASGIEGQQIEAFLVDFVVEQTGYPPEIIELDWDMESDLGIDSIKKAQLLGELREFFDFSGQQGLALDQLRSLRDIIHVLERLPSKGSWASAAAETALDATGKTDVFRAEDHSQLTNAGMHAEAAEEKSLEAGNVSEAAVIRDAQNSNSEPLTAELEAALPRPPSEQSQCEEDSDLSDMWESFLIDFVVEHTGYPREIVDLDVDLEADLGIDSIKKAQLLGELSETFHGGAVGDEHGEGFGSATNTAGLDELRTLRQILSVLSSATETATDTLEGGSEDGDSGTKDSWEDCLPQGDLEDLPVSEHGLCSRHEEVERIAISRDSLPIAVVDAVQSNLRAWVGRLDSESSSGHAAVGIGRNGRHRVEDGTWSLAPQDFAKAVGTLPESLEQLSHSILKNSHCQPLFPMLADEGVLKRYADCQLNNEVASEELSSTIWLAGWQLPTWLSSGAGGALIRHVLSAGSVIFGSSERLVGTAIEDITRFDALAAPTRSPDSGSFNGNSKADWIQWHIPGCLFPLAALRSDDVLVVGGGLACSQESSVEACSTGLEGWCQVQDAVMSMNWTSWQELTQAIRNCSTDQPWWLLVVDFKQGVSAHYQFMDGMLSIDRGGVFDKWLSGGSVAGALVGASRSLAAEFSGHDNLPHGNGGIRPRIFVGVDTRSQRLVFSGSVLEKAGYQSQVASNLSVPQSAAAGVGRQARLQYVQPEEDTSIATGSSVIGEISEATSMPVEPVAEDALNHKKLTSICSRYVLRMVPAPSRLVPGRQPVWSGQALVVGNNAVARQLEARLHGVGVDVTRLNGGDEEYSLAREFESLVTKGPVPHLFLTTPCDESAEVTVEDASWRKRRVAGVMSIYWLCQKWLGHIESLELVDDASLVAVTSLGGDFGFSGKLHSAEGGGLAGLLKSVLIESWMNGNRTLPIKVIDSNPRHSPAEIVGHVWQELAVPSYDVEVAYLDGRRHVVRAVAQELSERSRERHVSGTVDSNDAQFGSNKTGAITHGTTWVCTGGARGITAFVAESLAKRYGLRLRLLGKSPVPHIPSEWRNLDEPGRRSLKVSVMTRARELGESPVQAWQKTEKAIEIDATLDRMRRLGIDVEYYCCDVANREQLRQVLSQIRTTSGAIRGVLHGAGVGRDSRFSRKQAEKVQQCIEAKVDGAIGLIAETMSDPLECFVGFGSISGRFGANGHTDYSLANDMMCKYIDWLKAQRPDVNAIGFHWHAWGDVGMATKPETKLALEMVDMQFMPAAEGLRHLIREIESDASESEVLITDDRYYRMFYPAETIVPSSAKVGASGNLSKPSLLGERVESGVEKATVHAVDLDPTRDPFLLEHLLDNRPLLPFVIACEMMLEAARTFRSSASASVLCNVTAHEAIRFFSDAPRRLRVVASEQGEGQVCCEIRSDFAARNGKLIDRNRLNFSGVVTSSCEDSSRILKPSVALFHPESTQLGNTDSRGQVKWQSVKYPDLDNRFFLGWSLQRLRKFARVKDGLVGRIAAPALIELAGSRRDMRGWCSPSAVFDACLYATGLLAWSEIAAGTALPVRFARLEFGRLPSPGEACEVHVRKGDVFHDRARFDFTLYGVDGEVLIDAAGYEVAWLGRKEAESGHGVESSTR